MVAGPGRVADSTQDVRANRYASDMPFGIGIWELLILLLVLLLVFGPKRLPEMGRQLGKGMREFKDSVSGNNDDDVVDEVAELPPAVEPTTTATTARERDTVS
jgi:sec-independent protein translocase protein TatA